MHSALKGRDSIPYIMLVILILYNFKIYGIHPEMQPFHPLMIPISTYHVVCHFTPANGGETAIMKTTFLGWTPYG
jgi:hypothetical protein